MHFIYIFQCLEEFLHKTGLFFNQSKFIQNFLVSHYLFQSIEIDFRSVKNHELGFLKTEFDLFKLTFQKFFKLFFLSLTWQRLFLKFISFSTDLFACFSSLQASKSILPFLLHLFSCFHAFCWDFWTYSFWDFC